MQFFNRVPWGRLRSAKRRAVPGLILVGLWAVGAGVAAQAPAVLSPAEQAAQYTRQFAAPGAELTRLTALYRIEDLNQYLDAATYESALRGCAAATGLSPLLGAEVQAALAGAALRRGDGTAAAETWRKLGTVETWVALGPFDNSSPAMIEKEEGPEKGVVLSATLPGKQRTVGWRGVPFNIHLGVLELTPYFTPAESASVYLAAWVRSPEAQTVAVRVRDSGSLRMWVNGAAVYEEQSVHAGSGFDQAVAAARLQAGWNEILVKAGNSESTDWLFSARLTTLAGVPVVLESAATPQGRPAAGAAVSEAAADLTAEAAAATAAAGADHAKIAEAQWTYAMLLSHKQNFNQPDHAAANAYEAALAATPGNAALRLDFAEHDSDASRRYRTLEQLLAQAPEAGETTNAAVYAAARVDRGWIELDRNEYWPARTDFDAGLAMAGGAAGDARLPRAVLGEMEASAGMGSRAEALRWADRLQAAGGSPGLARAAAITLQRMNMDAEALQWLQRAHADDEGARELDLRLAAAERDSGDMPAALAALQGGLELSGDYPELLDAAARALAGMGRQTEALADINRAATLDPDNPQAHVSAGELESRFGHAAVAEDDWQTALDLNPQDATLRDRLQLARGRAQAEEQSFEKPYAQDARQLIAGYARAAAPGLESGPVVVLADSTVVNIFPSGNVGRYVQQVFRINNANGADSLAAYSVTYDPETEDVHFLTARVYHADGTSADAPRAGDQPVSESVGYETFYNVRNKYVEMPAMLPGDFVEIAYRVLPTTLESLYGDYFGDLSAFGGPMPTLYQQYVVLVPQAKNLYFKAVRFGGEAEQHTEGAVKSYRWSARNLPAFVGEPLAPPSIEQLPYIEVSSFQTWNQFAAWYTQLIRGTFVLNDAMVQTVNGLVAGKTSTEDKVDAIYHWVIANTHYVALEFGIHGYRPYPVTQVFDRRYGDCKDKASLLIAMLHQAGVPADFVLVRVREKGLVDATVPSVADFDHAIAYVPELHRYLDGTAEYNGARDLPGGDQRALVLHFPVLAAGGGAAVAPAGLEPQVTAALPPSENAVTRTLTAQLDGAGELHFTAHWEIRGERAPMYRHALEITDRQDGALQAMLHDRLPGISVTRARVQNETDWDQPLVIDFAGDVPRFASVNGTTLLIPRQFLHVQWVPELAPLATRELPELDDSPEDLQETLNIQLPAGYQIAAVAPTTLQSPFAHFEAAASAAGRQLELHFHLVTTTSLIEPAGYGEFRQFWTEVDAALQRPVTAAAADSSNTSAAAGGRQ